MSHTTIFVLDQDSAKAFYTELFGWEAQDNPIGEDLYYTIMKLDGKDVAAVSPQPEQQRDAGAPPSWNSYITVESADRALERARALGGTVHADAFDVMDVGRMGVVQDPQGAFFLVWEPKSHIGASLVNAPGALTWNELASPDLDTAASFYGELFGWTLEPVEGMGMPYMMIKAADGRMNGGIRPAMQSEPAYWLVYFGAEEIDPAVRRVGELGGKSLMGPMDIGAGKIAVVQDPQEAVFALFEGEFEE
jgi:predicted enzyme related to lactoylglutathione lyase